MSDFKQDFEREIITKNAFKKYAKKAIAEYLPKLEQFIGKKIFLADGSKAKIFNVKCETPVEKIEGMFVSVQIISIKTAYRQIELTIRLCFNGGSYDVNPATGWTKYVDTQFTIGKSEDGQILDSIESIEDIVKLYNLEDIIDFQEEMEKVKKYKDLQKQADNAKSAIKIDANYYKYL